jgi:hypothetical protein
VIWRRKLQSDIVGTGCPISCPYPSLDDLTETKLESVCLRSYRLSIFWKDAIASKESSEAIGPPKSDVTSFHASGVEGIAVSEVRLLPGTAGFRLVTASKGIWSALIVWDAQASPHRELARWTSQGSIFRGFVVNSNPAAEALVAISVSRDQYARLSRALFESAKHGICRASKIVILAFDTLAGGDEYILRETCSIETMDIPTALTGNILARSDAVSRTVVSNLDSGVTIAILRSSDQPLGTDHHPGLLVSTHLLPISSSLTAPTEQCLCSSCLFRPVCACGAST